MGMAAIASGQAANAPAKELRNAVVTLDHGWQFRQVAAEQTEDSGWLAATVPGDVHLDLLANKKIPDPFYRDNESKLQWIEKESWEYRLNFDATPELLSRVNVDLVFDGLDAACTVYLNGEKVLAADNMFRLWRVPAKGYLHGGKNVLRVVFPSPIKAAADAAVKDPMWPKTQKWVVADSYIHKAAYEYGWDWAPRFVTSGIWRPVRLEAWDKLRIADFHIRQRDVSKDVAHLDAEMEIEAASAVPAKLSVLYSDGGRPVTIAQTSSLHAGLNVINVPIEIRHPKLWYPAGYGDQPLYEFTAQVGPFAQPTEVRKVKTGLRSVVLRRELDQWGRSFEFIVNGIPIFAKGANVIPMDNFPNRVKTADYRRMLQSARDANMNMIRYNGVGIYEPDEFYAICDELGIMIWQDFMYADSLLPGTYAAKLDIEAEVTDQVRRLRSHPSIVLWCGNNELEGLFDWGGAGKAPADLKTQMWQDYLTEFSGILPRVVARLNPETPYWPSSKSADYERVSDAFQSGDIHDWLVWQWLKPFDVYEKTNYRFVSEYGLQSFPEWRTIESFSLPEDRTSWKTPVMLAHQKCYQGPDRLHDYVVMYYPEPKDFRSFVYVSQVLHAEAMKIGAEYHRRSRPRIMGSLFWQLNDCWPTPSGASIDYYGRWKALQYYARDFFAPILVSPHVEDGSVKVYIVSDLTAAKQASLKVRLMDFDGKVLIEESKPVDVSPLSSKVFLDWPMKKITDAGAADTTRVFVTASLISGGKEIASNLIYLALTREVHLPAATLKVETTGAGGKYKVLLTSPVLARSVYLSFGELDVEVSNNYFDILPGETVEIKATSAASLDALKEQLKVISLADAFEPGVEAAPVAVNK